MFTLVGIAGEDDLDAPDLDVVNPGPATAEAPVTTSIAAASKPHSGNGRARNGFKRPQSTPIHRPMLAAGESARFREGMLAEIEGIASADAATAWANTMLRAKNTLTADDAGLVERAFETRFAGLAPDPAADLAVSDSAPHGAPAHSNGLAADPVTSKPASAGEGARSGRKFPIIKTVRHRNKEHLRFVRTQPCLICAKQPSDPHHLPFAQPRALGRKVSDEYAVPLCRAHHREAHRAAKEISWWQSRGIAPLAVAETLWQKSQSGQALNEPSAPLAVPPKRDTNPPTMNGSGLALEKPVAG
jgi:hypothetical protein